MAQYDIVIEHGSFAPADTVDAQSDFQMQGIEYSNLSEELSTHAFNGIVVDNLRALQAKVDYSHTLHIVRAERDHIRMELIDRNRETVESFDIERQFIS